MVPLKSCVRMVALQFRFTNANVIPVSVKRRNQETQKEHVERTSRSSGIMVIEASAKCSFAGFLDELEVAGYELADALYQERPNTDKTHGRYTYHMVRFLFTRSEFVECSDEFNKMRDTIRAELRSICESAVWSSQVFFNPVFKNGEATPDQYAVSINLTARQPILQPDGQPVMVWQKDENGKRVGEAPLPLKADYRFCVVDDAIQLMKS